ncbi:MAG: PocR ligand-binding domain-containing protein [Mobilitalea sp.]
MKNVYDGKMITPEQKFYDIFDLQEIQELQDLFSAATGVASIITEPDGTPITQPSGFCNFCNEIVRKTDQGLKNCLFSDMVIGRPNKNGPRIQKCLSGGLMDGGASIVIKGQHIANWMIGQVLDEDIKLEDLLPYADVIGVDHEIYMNELSKVKRMPKHQFESICDFLFLNAKQLSKYVIHNIALKDEIIRKTVHEDEMKSVNKELEQNVKHWSTQLEETNAELEEMNAILEEEIREHERADEEIRKLNEELENKVLERTEQLQDMNAILEEEIDEKIRTENELSIERFFTDAVLDSVPGLLYLYDDQGKLVRWNKKHEEMTGYSSKELSCMEIFDWYKGDEKSIANVTLGVKRTLEEGSGDAEAYLQCKNGTSLPIYLTAVRLQLEGKIYFTGIGIDITDLKKREDENRYLSYHDSLTGLYNRRFYEEEIIRLDIEKNLPISIIMGDVNGLKLVNDAFGHDKGDEVLKKAAKSIQGACRLEDIVARWGGDEFVILLPKTNPHQVEAITKKIGELYSKEQVGALVLGISFGWSTKTNSDEDIYKVLKSAEDFMYKNKVIENASKRGNTINTIINTLHEKNPREEEHSKRVSEICQKIGKAIGCTETEISQLKVVGLLHDIGKIAIEESILNKPGKLTIQEWDQIKKHPDIGFRILSSSFDMLEIADWIKAHHERWDGEGYPNGISGESIPRIARIIAIADCYDAMTSQRSYREALSEEKAIYEISRNAGIQFDPEIARIFIEKVLNKPFDNYKIINI